MSKVAMAKIVSASAFTARCLQLIAEMEQDGQPVTITRRGKVVATLTTESAASRKPLASAFGSLRNDGYRFDLEASEPACDPDDWDADNPAGLYRRA